MTHSVLRLPTDAVTGALLTVTFAGSMHRHAAAANADAGGKPSRPNVLLICVDELKPVIGCYGDPLAVTPNIDRLAASGVRFDAAYCNQAVCSPSRNALLIGLRPQTLGIYDLPTNFRRTRPDAQTDPEELRNLAADRPQVVAELRAILAQEPEAKPQIVAQQGARQQQRRGPRKSRRPAAAAAS